MGQTLCTQKIVPNFFREYNIAIFMCKEKDIVIFNIVQIPLVGWLILLRSSGSISDTTWSVKLIEHLLGIVYELDLQRLH